MTNSGMTDSDFPRSVRLDPETRRLTEPDTTERRFSRILHEAHWLFLIVSFFSVGSFLMIVPAGWGLDEQSHVNRAYQISQGTWEPVLRSDGQTFGGDIPADLQNFEMLGHGWSNGVDRSRPYFERHDFRDRNEYETFARQTIDPSDPETSADFTNAGASTPFPYLPAAVGFVIGDWVNADVGQMVSLSRLSNAVTYVLLAFLSIRLLRHRRTKWLAFSLALLPSAIFQTSYVTADTFSNAATLLFCAVVARVVLNGGLASAKLITLLYIAGLGLVASKPTYVVLSLIVVFVPRFAFGTLNRSLAIKGGLMALMGVASVVALLSTRDIAGAIRFQRPDFASIDSARQLTELLQNPLEVLPVLARTTAVYGNSWVDGLVGLFGYNTVSVVDPFALICIGTVLLSALYGERLPRSFAWAALGTGVLTAVAVIMALYITYTPVGSPTAQGIQGRYFVPTLFLILVAVPSLLPCRLQVREKSAALLYGIGASIPLAGGLGLYAATLY